MFKLRRIISYEVLEDIFEHRQIGNIHLERDYAKNLFSKRNKKGSIKVVLEYDKKDEFEITHQAYRLSVIWSLEC